MTLAAVVGAIAVPQFTGLNEPLQRLNVRAGLLQDLKRAQAETITIGCRGIFTISAGGNSYSFGCDYLPYDTNYPPQSDVTSFQRTLPSGVSVTANAEVIFNSRGQSVDANDILSNVTISLSDGSGMFATGTLLGTGLFELNATS
ncbi:MAG: hypothetical protein KDD44_11650 [Bdellovibrionales bacterium]|nr:hypothetical protein [Bdellovibrionales bacterium]